jgi:predicted DNA-binding transcriptional regulator YafY
MSNTSDRFSYRFERVLLTVELLAPLRHGATAKELANDIGQILGTQYVERTIYRDLQMLQRMGIVQSYTARREGQCGKAPTKWKVTDGSLKAILLKQMAEELSKVRDSA